LGRDGHALGINRTVAQIHALLFISQKPLNAEDLVQALGVARSNVSNSLKELQGWGIVSACTSWRFARSLREHEGRLGNVPRVMDERKKREFDPTERLLRECIAEAEKDKETDEYTEQKLRATRRLLQHHDCLVWPDPSMAHRRADQIRQGRRQDPKVVGPRRADAAFFEERFLCIQKLLTIKPRCLPAGSTSMPSAGSASPIVVAGGRSSNAAASSAAAANAWLSERLRVSDGQLRAEMWLLLADGGNSAASTLGRVAAPRVVAVAAGLRAGLARL